jgi:hypothetical protein
MAIDLVIPKDQVELEEMLTDKKVMRELLGNPEKLTEFVNNHIKVRMSSDPGLLKPGE